MIDINEFKEGDIVRIKANAIKDGILKDKMKDYLFCKGIVIKNGFAACKDEVSVKFNVEFGNWILPINSLELISRPEKRYLYINVYKHYETIHNTQLEAQKLLGGNCDLIAKMKVEIDETRQDW